MQRVIHYILYTALGLLLLFGTTSSFAQYHVSGNNDSRIKYRQIKNDKFHIVYPDYYEENAQQLSRILDTIVPIIGNSLNTKAGNVPILIHTKSSISNGLSVWAPKRMEFWTTPPPTSYAYPFTWQLAIHEYRHTAQMQAVNVGITKIFSKLFGEHIVGGVAGIWVPNWFFEGDAVVAETALAPTGRGQEPEYNMYLKAQIIDKGRYSVDKMLLGSMKDFVADEYNLGYFLVSYGRQKYGKDIWGDCLKNIGKSWWKLTSWGKTKTVKGNLNFKTMYNEAIDTLEKVWIDDDINYMHTHHNKILKKWGITNNKGYVNYKNPIQINDSTILALKSSAYHTQELVRIVNNREEHLLSLPFLLHSYFQYRDNHILYSQYSPHVRWQQEAHADIMDYDLNTNKFKTVTSRATVFTPIYYPNDSLIATIYTDSLDNQNLAFIAPTTAYFKNKNILKKNKSSYVRLVSNENNVTYSYPTWEDDTTAYIYVIETSAKGKYIIRYNVTTADRQNVTEPSYDNIKYLKVYNKRLYFIKNVNNKYQLLSINVKDYNDVQIHTDSRYGIDNFCIYDSTIVVSDYTANGYKIVSLPYQSRPFNIRQKNKDMYFTKINREQEGFILCDSVINKDKVFASREYSKFKHLFKFHSWAPLFINIQSKELGIGVSAFSQNLLSTSILEFGFKFNFFDKNELFARYTYTGLYPLMELTTSFRPRDLRKELDSSIVQYIDWDEITVGYDITLPFTWTNRNYRNSINLTLHYALSSISNANNNVRLNVFNAIGYYANISNYAATASNDLYPRSGHITTIKYTHTLTSPVSDIVSWQSQIFAPGFGRNHSLVLVGSFQKNTPDVYYFPNQVSFVRGVYNLYPKYFAGLLSFYALPLIYPDSGINGVWYIKRIIARPFYHFGYYDKDFHCSYGGDIETKSHLFRITIPVNIGFRIGYSPTADNTFASLLFSLDI